MPRPAASGTSSVRPSARRAAPDVDEQERLLSAAAEHEKRADAARSEAQPGYDSAERRAVTARELEQPPCPVRRRRFRVGREMDR
jgi:hypothetical protein